MSNTKKILLLAIMMFSLFVIASSPINAIITSCTPSSSLYDSCFTSTTGYIKTTMETGSIYSFPFEGKRYLTDSGDVDARCNGDTLYLYNGKSPSCSAGGCSGAVNSWSGGSNHNIDLNVFAPVKPEFVCFESNEFGWGWNSVVWGTTYYSQSVECSTSAACSPTEWCDNSNPYETQCLLLDCAAGQVIKDHQCMDATIPQYCQLAGINDFFQCQVYLEENLDILSGTLDDKVAAIKSLEADIDVKVALIEQLTQQLDEQAVIVSQLTTLADERAAYIDKLSANLDEQVIMIDNLEASVAEKATIIADLQTNIADQADMINQLTSNLAIKAEYVDSLTAENQVQADLIAAMEDSFTNQADIISNLNATVEDDASIISNLDLTVDEQAGLIKELNLKVEDEAKIIEKLDLSNKEQQRTIVILSDNLEQSKALVKELQLKESELQAVIDAFNNKDTTITSPVKTNVPFLIGVVVVIFTGVTAFVLRRGKRK